LPDRRHERRPRRSGWGRKTIGPATRDFDDRQKLTPPDVASCFDVCDFCQSPRVFPGDGRWSRKIEKIEKIDFDWRDDFLPSGVVFLTIEGRPHPHGVNRESRDDGMNRQRAREGRHEASRFSRREIHCRDLDA